MGRCRLFQGQPQGEDLSLAASLGHGTLPRDPPRLRGQMEMLPVAVVYGLSDAPTQPLLPDPCPENLVSYG